VKTFQFALALLCMYSCTPYEDLVENRLDSHTTDDIYDITIDQNGDVHLYAGYVWSRCHEITLSKSYNLESTNLIADKALFDVLEDNNRRLLAVGTDGYLYTRDRASSLWTFHRLKHWDILHKIKQKPAGGYISVGGKSYEHGYLYHINNDFAIDTVTYVDHEISDIVHVNNDIWMTVGWGHIQRSIDQGLTWATLDIEGDFFNSIVFIDHLEGWITGLNGQLLHTIDGGLTWSAQKFKHPDFDIFNSIHILTDKTLIILGTEGRLWHSSDKGKSWTAYHIETSEDILGIIPVGVNRYLINGTGGFLSEVTI
jgi:hypothetical protein